MKLAGSLSLCFVLFFCATLLASTALGTSYESYTKPPRTFPTKEKSLTSEKVAKRWQWAKDDEELKDNKNASKARKLRKKGTEAAAEEEIQLKGWAALGEGLCAITGAAACAKAMDVFETSLKYYCNQTFKVLKKREQ